ncbi:MULTISPECIES: anti-sigma factor [unclassified Rhizobium]|uniref:anti-sigma factor family protein n=1 Tax=unclassified Rhizobium TaxID=2613769 RepID=UPI000EAAAC20|nr:MULTISPECIES: anti-sigma factor [unclassified Rhizobium]AYG67212.1 anti-sigma factor [Rhizobium sp. CCGE531]AYG73588.1 anti-sigma factor [Rhizobium sp. CCGE532]
MSGGKHNDHGEWADLLHGFIDGELDAANAARFEAHLATCRECADEMENALMVKRVSAHEGVKWQAPEAVHARVRAALTLEQAMMRRATITASQSESPWQRFWRFVREWSFVPSLAVLAASLMLVLNVPQQSQTLEDQLLASHVRSMLADHLTDVLTSDQHTVKPWFNGKIDFSPPVVDLAVQGFPLVGGRVDYLDGRVVAALIYHRHGHVINLFIWPGASGTRGTAEKDGYNFVEWYADGLVFWAISDVAAPDLTAFRDDFTRATTP